LEANQELEKNLNESKQSDDYFLNLVRFLKQDNNQEYQQMKRITLIFIALSVSIFTKNVSAQSNHIPNKCSTLEVTEQEMQKHPELKTERAKYEKSVQEYLLNNPTAQKSGNKRIIPVVFHVIHECGPENISRTQILDQIRVMNEDFSLTNANFSQTPAAFVPLAADCEIEFRLATKDDLGNCTDGIVRVFSPKTNEASNDNGVKSVSHWNSYKYLNVWVVKSIGALDGVGGEVLGYAQFPMGGLLSTDGVVIRHDCIGSIGTAASGSFGPRLGRTVTHEVGHWLGLRHIWGDADCGSDDVDDTPIAFGPNYGICWNDYPYNLTSCNRDSNDVSGEMFNNYMDYSDDQCMSMFTSGQKNRMDATFAGFRANLISEANLIATGTTDTDVANPVVCAPISNFCENRRMACADASISYTDASYNAQTYTRAWEFEGGTPATSSSATQSVTYANPGVFNVKLSTSNDIGSNALDKNDYVTISGSTAEFATGPFWDKLDLQEDFNRWITYNSDNSECKWEFSPNTGYGNWGSCLRIRNLLNTPSESDDLISPSYNVSSVVNPSMTFRLSGAEAGGTADDALKIYTSVNCGQTWVLRKTLSGAELVTAGLYTSEFVPNNPNQWQTYALGLASISSQTNVRFRFELVAGPNGSNDIYLDDLNIGSGLGFENVADYIGLSVYPNPSNGSTKVEFTTDKQAKVQIQLLNVLGQPVLAPYSAQVLPGAQNFNIDMTSFASGIYTVQLQIDSDIYYTKVIKN
jgi:PKD repeat protein